MTRNRQKDLPLRVKTIRQDMAALLNEEECTARDLSVSVGVSEKEVYEHLSHIAKTVMIQNKTLVIRPFECRHCGYVFKDRKRLSRPGRCPKCKGSYLKSAAYKISP